MADSCSEPNFPPLPFGVEGDPHLLTDGSNSMLVPFRAVDGTKIKPAYSFQDGPRTGQFRDPTTGYVWWVQEGTITRRMDLSSSGDEQRVSWLATNGSGSTIQAGQPVKLYSDGTLRLAQADDITNEGVGVVAAQVANGAEVEVVRMGPVTLADWTNVIGTTSLTIDTRYALVQGVAGKLSDTWPTGTGDLQQFFGRAITAQTLLVDVQVAAVM